MTLKITLPQVLSLLGGYVDTAGFLALQGLFTAHVTGNFVTLGASLVHGTSGVFAKLIALPVFCAVVVATRLLSFQLPKFGLPILRTMLAFELLLLSLGAVFAVWLGPFRNGDAWPALLTGMTLVSAMAIQNAAHRIHLGSAPPTTLMTGTTTQVMIDLADLMRHPLPEERAKALARLRVMSASVAAFALGCAAAAGSFSLNGMWCFVVPPVLLAASVVQFGHPEGAH